MGPVADIRASPASSRPVARTSALGQCLRPSLRAMQDAKNTDRRFRYDIGRDIRRAGDHQFARPVDPSGTAAFGKIAQVRAAPAIRSSMETAADGLTASI